MDRLIMDDLIDWKEKDHSKPLILQGVRQVGKTWILEEFGRRYFENTVRIDLMQEPELAEYFETSKVPERILDGLRLVTGQDIKKKKTLLIIDEIQESEAALNSLKYFCDEAPDYYIACAGSLLGVALAHRTFPVGKVHFLSMNPMTFSEFLMAGGKDQLAFYVRHPEHIESLPTALCSILEEQLSIFMITGGMPESVLQWIQSHSVNDVERIQKDILTAYRKDFSKHPQIEQFARIHLVFDSLPSQLSRENKKFLYNTVKPGARAREYEEALQWLIQAGLIHQVFRITKPGIPLKGYDDLGAFKLYLCDVGLLRVLAELPAHAFFQKSKIFTEFKGSLTENYVLQHLKANHSVRYWSKTNPSFEVDFIIQHGLNVIPVEVKSDLNITSKSLQKYQAIFPDQTPLRVRFSLQNLKLDGTLLNIPLYLVEATDELIEFALKELESDKNIG